MIFPLSTMSARRKRTKSFNKERSREKVSDARLIITGHQEETECCMNLQEYLASELVRLFESGLVTLTKKSEVVFMSQAITSNSLLTREIGK